VRYGEVAQTHTHTATERGERNILNNLRSVSVSSSALSEDKKKEEECSWKRQVVWFDVHVG
jgi:hypothetical protein